MADNAMARLTFFVSFFLFTFSVLLVIILAQKIIQIILRRRLRTLISEDSQHDLVGREAVVTRTVRQNKAGRIQLAYQGSEFFFKANCDQKLYIGTKVQITAVTPQGFRVSKINYIQNEEKLLGDETEQTLRKAVVQDINIEPEQDESMKNKQEPIPGDLEHASQKKSAAKHQQKSKKGSG